MIKNKDKEISRLTNDVVEVMREKGCPKNKSKIEDELNDKIGDPRVERGEIDLKEFELYRQILDDNKMNLMQKNEKNNKINSLFEIAKKKEIRIKKDDMSICKYRININQKNNTIETLKKQTDAYYHELKKIREKQIEEEHKLWATEVIFFVFVNITIVQF